MSVVNDAFCCSLSLYQTQPYACSYLQGRDACSQVVVPAHLVDTPVYSKLIHQGFRRSGLLTYRPYCDGCSACRPLRIPVAAFNARRSQKRVWQRLTGVLQVRVMKLHFFKEHYQLYQRYQEKRHAGGGMDHDNQEQYEQFLLHSHVNAFLVEYRLPPCEGQERGALKMVSVMDMLHDGLSAVYTFFDPDDGKAGYGTYGVLWQIQYAKMLMLPYVYLGYWVQACSKMAYKTRFQPHEVLTEQGWVKGISAIS